MQIGREGMRAPAPRLSHRLMRAGLRLSGLRGRGRRNVLDHLASCGSPAARGEIKGRPKGSAATQAQIRKVGALLHQMRLPWSYADGIAKQMWHVDKLDWCTSLQLRGVITALEKEWAKRRARELAEEAAR